MGLPGAGKTTLAEALTARLNAVHFNADAVRTHINRDLGFSVADRIEQARRLGWLCDQVTRSGAFAVADFVCPTEATRDAFGRDAFLIWVDRIKSGRFEDTNRLFEPPIRTDLHVTPGEGPDYWAERATRMLRPHFDPKKPTALFVGRYQPFHDGHKALIEAGLLRVGQACIAVRDTHGTNLNSPLAFDDVKLRIETGLRAYFGRFLVVPLPNISHIFYGRDVGYRIERIGLDRDLEQISATDLRARIGV
jgi:hypothetical protein